MLKKLLKLFRSRIYRLPILLFLLAKIYGCTPELVAQAPEPESAAVTASAVAQEAGQGEETPAQVTDPVEQAAAERLFQIEELWVDEEQGQTKVRVQFSSPITQYRHFAFTRPARIVVDVFVESKQKIREETFDVRTRWVSELRVTTSEGNLRMVAEVAGGAVPAYAVEPVGNGLEMTVGPVEPAVAARRELKLVEGGKRVGRRVAAATPPTPGVPPSAEEAPAPRAPAVEREYTGQRISLDFKDADIKNVFRLLAEVSGLNMVVTEDVVRKVTIRLIDVPWDQALDILLQTNGLAKEEKGNVLRISTVQRLRSEKDDIRAAKEAEERLEPLQTAFLNVNYARVRDLEPQIQGVLSERGKVFPDERTNTVIIRDTRKAIEDASELVNKIDTRTPQVLIESNIIETTPSFARALGAELGFTAPFNERSGGALFPQRGGLGLTPETEAEQDGAIGDLFNRGASFQSNAAAVAPFSDALGLTFSVIQSRVGALRNVTAALSAAETEGNIRTISRPSVVTLNNVQSDISSLRVLRIALPSGTTNIASGSGSAAGAAVATEQVPVGIFLSVTPQVSSDGFILLNISVKSSSLGSQSSGAAIPDEITQQANSYVLVRNGETVVLGGVMKDTRQEDEAGIPYLKDIPVFGWLFKRISFEKRFEELMVFITPRVIEAGSPDLPSAEQLWRDSLSKTEGE